MPKQHTREDIEALYAKLVATHTTSELKGDTVPYASHNGHMYSYLSKDGIVALRLPDDKREEFMQRYEACLMQAYGIVQKEYVAIPATILSKTSELKPYFKAAFDHVNSLKPKQGKKK
jgi:hypothetical protein